MRARLEGRSLERYRPQRDFLSLLNLGDSRALASKWGFATQGRAIARLKSALSGLAGREKVARVNDPDLYMQRIEKIYAAAIATRRAMD